MISMPSTHWSLLSSDRYVGVTDVFSYDTMSLHLSQPRCSRRMEWGFVKQSPNLRECFRLRFHRGMLPGDANVTIIDRPALLWPIHWPADGSVADFGVNVKTRITKYLTNSNIYSHQTLVRGIYKRDVIHQATCFMLHFGLLCDKEHHIYVKHRAVCLGGGRVTVTN